jgi:hypothetical protein
LLLVLEEEAQLEQQDGAQEYNHQGAFPWFASS